MSYFPTYSNDWSKPFLMTNETDLPFLLTVQAMRWQVRMRSDDPAASPALDSLDVNHAPVEFPKTGVATTNPIGPPDGLYVLTWGDLVVDADQPGATGVTVEVQDDAGARVVAPQTMTGGALTIPLAGVAPLGAKLVAVCSLSGDGLSTPTLKSLTVTFTTTTTPSSLTLTSSKSLVAYGGSVTLSGLLTSDPTPLVADDGNTIPLGGQTVTIRKHVAGTTGYTLVGTAVTGADGSFTYPPLKPAANTTYRAEWAGGVVAPAVEAYPPASGSASVQVKPKVTVAVAKYNSRSGKYYRYKLGRVVYVKGSMTPNHARLGDGVTAGKVTVVVYRYRSATRTWVKAKSSVRTLTRSSAYTWSYRPSARGTYRLRTTFAGDVDHVAAQSSYRYVKVY